MFKFFDYSPLLDPVAGMFVNTLVNAGGLKAWAYVISFANWKKSEGWDDLEGKQNKRNDGLKFLDDAYNIC